LPNIYLTNEFVFRAKCPAEQDQVIYWDHPKTIDGKIRNGSQAGLGLRVTKNGHRSFVHTFRFNGRRKRSVIAKASIGVESARLLVLDRVSQLDDGTNPDQKRIDYSKKHALTFRDITEMYEEQHLSSLSDKHRWEFGRLIAPWFRGKPNQENQRGRNMRSKFPAFGNRFENCAAESLTPTDVGRFIKGIESDYMSNAALVQLKALFNWAIRMQLIDIRNPCSPFQKRKIIRKRREYTPEDIAALSALIFNPSLEAIEALDEDTPKQRQRAALIRGSLHKQNIQMTELCNFLGILFLTMARPNELKQAKFEHFDLKRLVWQKHNTKGIKLSRSTYEYAYRAVPIHHKVAELVQKQKDRWPDAEYVFPSHTDQSKPRDNFNTALKRFKKLSGVPSHFQIYDIKRIAISLMITGRGIRREDVSHYVDHRGNIDTTLLYDLGFVDPMRPVAEKLGELLGV